MNYMYYIYHQYILVLVNVTHTHTLYVYIYICSMQYMIKFCSELELIRSTYMLTSCLIHTPLGQAAQRFGPSLDWYPATGKGVALGSLRSLQCLRQSFSLKNAQRKI